VGQVFAAIATKDEVKVQLFTWGGTRSQIQNRTAKMAINLLRLELMGLEPSL
jgi:nicotinamide-nucleotide amidase